MRKLEELNSKSAEGEQNHSAEEVITAKAEGRGLTARFSN